MSASSGIKDKAKGLLESVPPLYKAASAVYRSLGVVQGMAYVAERAPRIMMGAHPIIVSHTSIERPRWGHGQPAHAGLAARIGAGRARYEDLIASFGAHRA